MSISTLSRKSTPMISHKTNSLLALRKALLEERYEDCAGHVSKAVQYQATLLEITQVFCKPAFHPENYD